MSREEAKTFLLQLNTEKIFNVSEHEAIRVAIKALSQEPTDAISREAVLNMQYRIDDSATLSTRDVVNVEDIEDLPSVTQKSETVTEFADRCRECGAKYGKLLEQKSGKWIWNVEKGYCKCSKCGIGMGHTEFDYCPNCGAKMESEEE